MSTQEVFRCSLGMDIGNKLQEFESGEALTDFIASRARQTVDDFVAYVMRCTCASFETPDWRCFAADILNYSEALVLHLAGVDKNEDVRDNLFNDLFDITEVRYAIDPWNAPQIKLKLTFVERPETTERRKAWEEANTIKMSATEVDERKELARLFAKYGAPR